MQRSNSGAQPACAACKHQRKKCSEGCVLAPYFPAERAREFQAVHKVFGVSNVTKMVRGVGPGEEDRRNTVDSLVWEACCRQRDPVLGPYAEYRRVFDELRVYKSREIVSHQLPAHHRTVSYKSLTGLVGWNGGGNNGLSYGQSPFGYAASFAQSGAEKMRHEKGVDPVVPGVLQAQHSLNGFNHQQYYLSGQLMNQVNNKTNESTVWEGGS